MNDVAGESADKPHAQAGLKQQGKTHLLLMLLVAVAGLAAWQVYEMRFQLNVANQQVDDLSKELSSLQDKVKSMQDDIVRLDKGSVQGLVSEANDVILSGWESLVNTVGNELKKAREELDKAAAPVDPNTAPQPPSEASPDQPQLESDDGTDKT